MKSDISHSSLFSSPQSAPPTSSVRDDPYGSHHAPSSQSEFEQSPVLVNEPVETQIIGEKEYSPATNSSSTSTNSSPQTPQNPSPTPSPDSDHPPECE